MLTRLPLNFVYTHKLYRIAVEGRIFRELTSNSFSWLLISRMAIIKTTPTFNLLTARFLSTLSREDVVYDSCIQEHFLPLC